MAEGKNPTPGEITIMAAGVVALIFSFFDFYKSPFTDDGVSVWSSGLFPVATLMVIFVVVMAVQVALGKFANVDFPAPLGYSWPQIHLMLGFVATLYALAYLLQDRGGIDLGIGYWLILVASIAALVGAVLLQRERTTAPGA